MKAVIKNQVSNAKNYSGDKETISTYKAVTVYKGEVVTPLEIRVYMGRSSRASVVYASLWIHDSVHHIHTSGTGSAGGYGYHKESAAIAEAISSAGIELWGSPYGEPSKYTNTPEELKALKRAESKRRCHISGCGDSSVQLAMRAIVKALGYRGKVEII